MPDITSFPGSKVPPQPKKKRVEEIIDHLFQVLEAPSVAEIVERLNKRGLEVNEQIVSNTLNYLRKNSSRFGWTVPYVRTGAPGEGRVYFAILLNKDGSFYTDPEFEDSVDLGQHSMLSRSRTELRNLGVQLAAIAKAQGTGIAHKRQLLSMSKDLEWMATKTEDMIEEREEANGA